MKNTFIFLLLFIPLFVFCSDPLALTVADAVQRGLSANQDLILAGKATKAALRELEYSWNMFLPSINSSIGLSGSDSLFLPSSDSNESDDDPWNLSASVSLQLPLHISSAKEIKQKRLDFQLAELLQEEGKAGLIRDIQKTYFLLLTFLKDIEIKKNGIAIAQGRYNSVVLKYDKGLSSDLDVLKAQITLENGKPAYEKALADYNKKLITFKRLIGINRNTEIELTTPLEIKEISFALEEWITTKIDARFDIQKSLMSIQSNLNEKEKSIQSTFIPNLSVSTSWSTGINQAFTADSWNINTMTDNLRLGLSLSIPLDAYIPFSKKAIALKDFNDTYEELLIKLEKTRLNAEDEIYSLTLDLQVALSNLKLSEKIIELNKRNYTKIMESYELGESTLLEVEDAQQSLLSSQLSQLNTEYQYLSTLIDLGFALNTDWQQL